MGRRARKVMMVGTAGVFLGGTLTCAGTAQAAGPAIAARPGYLCDRTHEGNKGKGWGVAHCEAVNGAPEHGEIRGAFLIDSRNGTDPTFACRDLSPDGYPSGNADLPRKVYGFYCEAI